MRGHIEKRGDGAYRLLVDLPRGADQKRKRLSRTVRGTKKQAEAELARILSETNDGTFIKPSELSCSDYFDRWLSHAKGNLSPTTYRGYKRIIDAELKPAFGFTKLGELSPLQVQGFLADALEHPSKRDGERRSPRTVLRFYMLLNKSLNQAVRWQLIQRNPCSLVDPPKAPHVEMRALDETEIKKVLGAAKGTSLYGPVLLAIATGMRRGEILGLRWSDVDLSTGELNVVRSLQDTESGLVFKAPKTRKGRRVVLLPPGVVEALKEHEARGTDLCIKRNAHPGFEDLVFCRADGMPWHPGGFSAEFHHFMRNLGVVARFHDLRHTHATQLLKRGVPISVVSERLGHAKASITLDVYSHVLPSMQQQAAEKVGEMMAEVAGLAS